MVPGVDNVVGAVIETDLSDDTSDKNEDMVDSISIESDGSEEVTVGKARMVQGLVHNSLNRQ